MHQTLPHLCPGTSNIVKVQAESIFSLRVVATIIAQKSYSITVELYSKFLKMFSIQHSMPDNPEKWSQQARKSDPLEISSTLTHWR